MTKPRTMRMKPNKATKETKKDLKEVMKTNKDAIETLVNDNRDSTNRLEASITSMSKIAQMGNAMMNNMIQMTKMMNYLVKAKK